MQITWGKKQVPFSVFQMPVYISQTERNNSYTNHYNVSIFAHIHARSFWMDWNRRKCKPIRTESIFSLTSINKLLLTYMAAIELNWTEPIRIESLQSNKMEKKKQEIRKPKPKDFFEHLSHLILYVCSVWLQKRFSSFNSASNHIFILHCGGRGCDICALKATWAIHANRFWMKRKSEELKKNEEIVRQQSTKRAKTS